MTAHQGVATEVERSGLAEMQSPGAESLGRPRQLECSGQRHKGVSQREPRGLQPSGLWCVPQPSRHCVVQSPTAWCMGPGTKQWEGERQPPTITSNSTLEELLPFL